MSQQNRFALRVLVLVALTFLVVALMASTSYGHKVRQGKGDTTVTYNSDFNLRACDGEADGNPVYGRAYGTAPNDYFGRVEDNSGANDGRCGEKRALRKIGYHQTCENDGGFYDSCSRKSREP